MSESSLDIDRLKDIYSEQAVREKYLISEMKKLVIAVTEFRKINGSNRTREDWSKLKEAVKSIESALNITSGPKELNKLVSSLNEIIHSRYRNEGMWGRLNHHHRSVIKLLEELDQNS